MKIYIPVKCYVWDTLQYKIEYQVFKYKLSTYMYFLLHSEQHKLDMKGMFKSLCYLRFTEKSANKICQELNAKLVDLSI